MAGCPEDCSCSLYFEALGIDTSHVFVLARTCREMDDGSTLAQLLELHGCNGGRRLLTSSALASIEMLSEDLVDLAGTDELRTAVDILEPVEHREHQVNGLMEFVYKSTEFAEQRLGERDATLVAVACAEEHGAVVVSDDEELLVWLGGANDDDVVDMHAEPSVSMLGKLHTCGAIGTEVLEATLAAEEHYQRSRGGMATWKLKAKLDRIDREISRLARAAAGGTDPT